VVKFSEELISKYGRHVVTHSDAIDGVDAQGQQFPNWWLRSNEVGFSTWSPSRPFHGVRLDADAAGAAEAALRALNQRGGSAGTLPTVPTVLAVALFTVAAYLLGRRHRGQSRDVDDEAMRQSLL